MPQLPLFGDAPHSHPLATRSIARPTVPRPQPRSAQSRSDKRSPRSKHAPQPPLVPTPAATVVSIPTPPTAIDRLVPLAPTSAKELPQGWVDPKNPAFNSLKNYRLCGAPIKIGGLDHSLCSTDCGWVVDLQWLAWMETHRRKRKETDPQAATHTASGKSEAFDLFSDGLDRDSATRSRAAASDRNTSKTDGGAA
ncbi:hypothetical protein H6F67_21180 [Microcoleus sp. FACHB-1515]|uniref:hypothetical protein n=1 Tax=Cyanophyceae TaxID=3028117 RepID=UPI001687FC63|nr:hypothetical protein [Microcoleus sp. FACHB-1515]MBD2092366.1 hypothetical protein [Microcoleus sp. FACHB-1515]